MNNDLYFNLINFNNILGEILSILVLYKTVYFIIGIFFTKKFKKAKHKYKYGICIAARNEEKVIGNLIDSINKQKYPKKLYKIFVVADNCTDKTKQIAVEKGAICYERFDNEHKTKGYALQYLFENIKKDYGISSFDGYFIFDADNLLKEDYLKKMNDAFDSGKEIITSCRLTKNFDSNWISAGYAIHWLRSIRFDHRARSVLNLSTNIQGTGFLISNKVVKNGFNYTSLTEDRALTIDATAQGFEISYQDEAIFYDEQPVNLKTVLRQRLRWSKGHLEAFKDYGLYLFINIFLGKRYVKTKWEDNNKKGLKESIRHRFASFDIFMQTIPMSIISLFRWIIFNVLLFSIYSFKYGYNNINILNNIWFFEKLNINFYLSCDAGIKALFTSLLITITIRILYRLSDDLYNMLTAIYLFIIDKSKMPKMKLKTKIFFIITWPIFDIIGRYTTYIALFKKVTWKPIPHDSKITIDDLK